MTSKIMPTYFSQMPVSFEYGKGAWLWDTAGNEYLDAYSGIAVCSLGHAHPEITKTISEQAGKLLHTSNTFIIAKQIELAERLTRVAGMDQVYFCNSGGEANETAIKLSRLYARKKSIAEPIVITMKHSFHGRTLATLSASGTERIQTGFEPLVKEFLYVTLNDIAELDAMVKEHAANIVGILLEPVQGDGGIQIASHDYMQHIRNLCDQHDWLMMVDEVQTGVARTGKWFSYQHTSIKPDIMAVAKALGNGIPIGACLARGKACNLFGPGKHGTTFGGNQLAMAVGCSVIDIIEKNSLVEHAERMGNYLQKKLKSVLGKYPNVIDVRGQGLMIGVEFDKPCFELPAIGMQHQILFNVTFNTVIRLLPPIIISEAEADEIVVRLDRSIEQYLG